MPAPSQHELRYWNLLSYGEPHQSRAAAGVLSSLLSHRGERGGAEHLLRDSLKAHGSDGAAETWFRLGRLLEEESRLAEAEAAYAQASSAASVEECPEVLMDLAALWETRGASERSIVLYERVATDGSGQQLRALARYRLGRLHRQASRLEMARRSLVQALAEADAALEPFALVRLGELEAERGENVEAAELLQRAVAGNHHDQAPRAALALARLRAREGDGLEAYRLYQLAVESAHPEVTPAAAAEQRGLIESELDLLLMPTLELSEQQSSSKPAKLPPDLMGRDADVNLTRALWRLCEGVKRGGWVPAFERHESSLLVPRHGIDRENSVRWPEAANLWILDPESHRSAGSACAAGGCGHRPSRRKMDEYLRARLNHWFHREPQWEEAGGEIDLLVLLYLVRGRFHLAEGQDQTREDLWRLLAVDPSPGDNNNSWTQPLLTTMVSRRIAEEGERAAQRAQEGPLVMT